MALHLFVCLFVCLLNRFYLLCICLRREKNRRRTLYTLQSVKNSAATTLVMFGPVVSDLHLLAQLSSLARLIWHIRMYAMYCMYVYLLLYVSGNSDLSLSHSSSEEPNGRRRNLK